MALDAPIATGTQLKISPRGTYTSACSTWYEAPMYTTYTVPVLNMVWGTLYQYSQHGMRQVLNMYEAPYQYSQHGMKHLTVLTLPVVSTWYVSHLYTITQLKINPGKSTRLKMSPCKKDTWKLVPVAMNARKHGSFFIPHCYIMQTLKTQTVWAVFDV